MAVDETRMPLAARLLTWCLAFLLAAYGLLSYPSALAGEIAASTGILMLAAVAARWVLLRRRGHKPSLASALLPSTLAVFLCVFSALFTVQAILAQEIYAVPTLRSTPGYGLVVRLLHYLLVVVVISLGPRRDYEAALGTAIMYTSTIYTPTFFTQEAAPPFVAFRALALILIAATLRLPRWERGQESITRRLSSVLNVTWRREGPSLAPVLLLILASLIAVLLSYSPSESLGWFLNLLTLLAFIWVFPRVIHSIGGWKRMAFLVITFSIVIPVALSAIKLVMLAWQLDLRSVLDFRLALMELGSHNLIARSLATGTPLLIAWVLAVEDRTRRIAWLAFGGLTLIIFITCKSWSGATALALAGLFLVVLRYGEAWVMQWRARRSDIGWYLLHVALVAAALSGLFLILRLAPQARVGSVDGRILGFQAALKSISEHPVWGVGPGHTYLMSSYSSSIDWLVDTRVTLDNALLSTRRLVNALPLHAHNLFLEIGRGMGILGLSAFVWLLVDLLRSGLHIRAKLDGQGRIFVVACLSGMVAALGWALLDVMVAVSPFFAFPTWAITGLLLAAPRAFGAQKEQNREAQAVSQRPAYGAFNLPRRPHRAIQAIVLVLLLGLTFVAVIAPLFGNLHYRAAFSAYQGHVWTAAVEELDQASRWEPLHARYHELRGAALINLGRYAEAASAYEHAVRLRRGYAPYHAQLGWLYWLEDDLEESVAHFQRAVDADPFEAWRDGLNADLGLVNAALGNTQEAVERFKETIELDPRMASAPYWVPEHGEDGSLDVVLDPAYVNGPSSELEKRILAHLGKAEHTPRLFEPFAAEGTLSLNQVLDGVGSDYLESLAAGGRDAPRLLATAAEAARLVGLSSRAERAYLEFQETFPASAHGFRDLGSLYREQGQLDEAQEMLEAAVQISPSDTASWFGLAELHLQQGNWQEAREALDTVYRLSPLDAHLYELLAQLHRETGEVDRAVDALEKSLAIEESISNRLALAELYFQLGDVERSTAQCMGAADHSIRTSARPLEPELWAIGQCLARSTEEGPPRRIAGPGSQDPFAGQILAGHFHRARNQLEPALTAYQAAAAVRPHEAAPHFFIGSTYEAQGRPVEAEAAYRRAAELDPLESLPLVAIGRMQWAQGYRDAALESLRAAVAATPGWGEAHTNLGNAYLALGDRESASRHYHLAQAADRAFMEGLVYDFSTRLASAEIQAPGPEYVRNDYFAINGATDRSIFMHPVARARYTLEVPDGGLLTFQIGTAPESWDKPGDGVDFAVFVESGDAVEEVFSSYIDPKQDQSARRWHSHTLDLSKYAGQTVGITFQTGPGPAGDDRYDWAGWSQARIMSP